MKKSDKLAFIVLDGCVIKIYFVFVKIFDTIQNFPSKSIV